MSLSEGVRLLLAARAATDPDAARLLETFTKADEICKRMFARADRECRNIRALRTSIS
jgi:hypothetical protein